MAAYRDPGYEAKLKSTFIYFILKRKVIDCLLNKPLLATVGMPSVVLN